MVNKIVKAQFFHECEMLVSILIESVSYHLSVKSFDSNLSPISNLNPDRLQDFSEAWLTVEEISEVKIPSSESGGEFIEVLDDPT